MKKKIPYLALFFTIFYNLWGFAQAPLNEWVYTQVGGEYTYKPAQVIQNSSNEYILAGTQYNNNTFRREAYLSKVGSDEQLIWETDLGIPDNGYGTSFLNTVVSTIDGYLVAGYYSQSAPPFDSANFVAKVSVDGNLLWTVEIEDPVGANYPNLEKAIQLSDGNFLITGINRLTKISDDGTIIFNEAVDGGDPSLNLYMNDLVETSDGTIYISATNGSSDIWVGKFDSDGSFVSGRNVITLTYLYGGTPAIAATSDGGLILGTVNTLGSIGDIDYFVTKLDASLNTVWENDYGSVEDDFFYNLNSTQDGGVIILGKPQDEERQIAQLIKIDSEGNQEWDSTYDVGEVFASSSVIQTNDLGYAFTGVITNSTYGDLFVYKLEGVYDGGVSNLQFNANSCSESYWPFFTLTNNGANIITSAEIHYYTDDETPTIFNWTGSLEENQSEDINLPSVTTLNGEHTLTIELVKVNGVGDANLSNAVVTKTYTSNRYGTSSITLTLQLDEYPEETSWEIMNDFGNTIYSGDSYTNQFGIVTETFNLDMDRCYYFSINDTTGDGMTEGIAGYFKLETVEGVVFAQNGDFGYGDATNFYLSSTLGIDDIETPEALSLYPNPTSDVLNINSEKAVQQVELYNVTGKLVMKTKPQNNQLNISELSKGIYFIKINGNSIIYKVIKN